MTAATTATFAFLFFISRPGGDCPPPCPPGAILEGEACGTEINRGCFGAPPEGSDCCEVHGTFGCDNARCQGIVCAVDSFCCAVAWDQFCVDEALEVCPELCSGGFKQLWSPIELGQTVCGTTHAEGVDSNDSDWYEFHLDAITEVTVTIQAGLPMLVGIVDDDGIPDCAFAEELEPVMTARPCGNDSITACLEAGTHWIVVEPAVNSGYPCGSPHARYQLELAGSSRRCMLPDPVNDSCESALPISLGETHFSTHDAATEPDARFGVCFGQSVTPRDIWYEFVASRTAGVRFSMCGTVDFAAEMTVYHGTCSNSTLVDCDSGANTICPFYAPEIDIDAVAGEHYLIRIGSGSSNEEDGTGILTVSYLPCTPAFVITTVAPTFGSGSIAEGISEDGEIVGSGKGPDRGFRWTAPTGGTLVVSSTGQACGLLGVNDAGLAVGTIVPSINNTVPAVAAANVLSPLPVLAPPLNLGVAHAVNNAGVIVGEVGPCCGANTTPVRWVGGALEVLPIPAAAERAIAINQRGDICGDNFGSTPPHDGWALIGRTFNWISSPDPDTTVRVGGMNDLGQVVGNLESSSSIELGFIWSAGEMTTLVPPAPFDAMTAVDINNSGTVVGIMTGDSFSDSPDPFVWTSGRFVRINSRLSTGAPSPPGPIIKVVRGINDAGEIVGSNSTTLFSHTAVRVQPVPPGGDLNCDGHVDGSDLGEFLSAWGECPMNTACPADFTIDGLVDGADLAVLLAKWTG